MMTSDAGVGLLFLICNMHKPRRVIRVHQLSHIQRKQKNPSGALLSIDQAMLKDKIFKEQQHISVLPTALLADKDQGHAAACTWKAKAWRRAFQNTFRICSHLE